MRDADELVLSKYNGNKYYLFCSIIIPVIKLRLVEINNNTVTICKIYFCVQVSCHVSNVALKRRDSGFLRDAQQEA